jgi:hypothetical protein
VLKWVPDLLLAHVIGCHRKRYELIERHAVLGVDAEQLFRNRREAQPLLDDGHAAKEPSGDFLLARALFAQGLERT